MKFCQNFADNLENDKMLKISEFFEVSRGISYFERIRMVRLVRMVRSLADRTFQPRGQPPLVFLEAREWQAFRVQAVRSREQVRG